MEEELVKILSNTELDDTKKAEEIQKAVNALYVPATTVAEERKANKEALANKDKAFADLTAEYDTYKQSKMTEEEKIKLLASDGMLIKRPLIVSDDKILVGFKEQEWKEYFNK